MIDTTGQPNQLAAQLVRMQRSAAAKWQLNPTHALPFCNIRLSGPKPPPKAYPKHLKTLGDHLRKRRLDLGLLQKDVADGLAWTSPRSVIGKATEFSKWCVALAAVIGFLGHNPLPEPDDRIGKFKSFRISLGLTQEQLAQKFGIDESIIAGWERGENTLSDPTANSSKISLPEMASFRSDRAPPQPKVNSPRRRSSRSGRSLA